MNPNTALTRNRRAEWSAAGLCVRCGKLPQETGGICVTCLDGERERYRKKLGRPVRPYRCACGGLGHNRRSCKARRVHDGGPDLVVGVADRVDDNGRAAEALPR